MAATYPAGSAGRTLRLVSAIHVPGYEIVEVLGRGRFGVVHRARQEGTGREVAVRVDTRPLHDDGDRQRFLRELRVARRLSDHPHVVETRDGGVLPDGRPYLVMEVCPGGSLADRGPLPPREVAQIGQQIADALVAAHDLGVLHGDVRPGNLLVKAHGTVGLADFGLAAVIGAGGSPVAPDYAAPETLDGRPPTARSDVYSLAATLHALLAGAPPRLPVEDLPGVSPALMSILRRGLAEDPARRFPEAAALRAELSQLTVEDLAGPAGVPRATSSAADEDEDEWPSRPPRPPAAEPEPDRAPGRRAWLAGAALVVVLVVLAAVWFLVQR